MITHNGTYLLHATHHGMPIYAATMGGKMILDCKWMNPYTLQAIVAAFGAEGTEVIRKTNDYLNRIATTDPARALQISAFINEDPLLVTSLVETSKRRYLESSGGAYIKTSIEASDQLITEASFAYLVGGQYPSVFGAATSGEAQRYTIHSNTTSTNVGFRITGASINVATEPELWNDIKISKEEIVCNGNVVGSFKSSFIISYKMAIFAENQYGTYPEIRRANARIEFVKFSRSQIAHFIPMQRNGENGMLDIISGTFHPNANTQGSFTISLTDKA